MCSISGSSFFGLEFLDLLLGRSDVLDYVSLDT